MTDSAHLLRRPTRFPDMTVGDMLVADIVDPHLLEKSALLTLFERLLEQHTVSIELLESARVVMDDSVRARRWRGGDRLRIVLRVDRSYIVPLVRQAFAAIPATLSIGTWNDSS